MVLDAFFRRASETFPIPVMLRALLERVFEPARLNDWFEAVTEKQYTRELLFSSAFELMSVVVFKAFGSVHAAYQAKRTAGEITVSVTSVYNKLNGVEAQTSRALVRDTAGHLRHLVEDVQGGCRPWLPGYRVKVLDGNCIAATEHRLQVLRTTAAGPLPGKALVAMTRRWRWRSMSSRAKTGTHKNGPCWARWCRRSKRAISGSWIAISASVRSWPASRPAPAHSCAATTKACR